MTRGPSQRDEFTQYLSRMDASDDALAALEQHLQQAEAELQEREEQARSETPPPEVLLALAAERDKIATERDAIADAEDERATARDRSALRRDVVGSGRDRRSRAQQQDLDPAALDRFASGVDRDFAAGDRGDSFDDRGRAHQSRTRAAANREHAADDRDAAAQRAKEQTSDIAGLRAALESRLVIGQAEGLLMAQHGLSPQAAFQVLVRLSQEGNVKLREVAAALVADAAGDSSGKPAEGG